MIGPRKQKTPFEPGRASPKGVSKEISPDCASVPEDAATVIERLVRERLAEAGLETANAEGGCVVIAGQAFDLRSARAFARRLGDFR